jgi:hypothetical protein
MNQDINNDATNMAVMAGAMLWLALV